MDTNDHLMDEILKVEGVLEIRDINNGEEPFLYTSGSWGPGYVSIKSLVAQRSLFKAICHKLACKVEEESTTVGLDFVAGNATGGMIPGWLLSDHFKVPFVYMRGGARQKGERKREPVTGLKSLGPGTRGIVVEELVNFAQTTINSTTTLRELGFRVENAACILFYNNPEANRSLEIASLRQIYLFTLLDLLQRATTRLYPVKLVDAYLEFLSDPSGWQKNYLIKHCNGRRPQNEQPIP